MKQMLLAVLLLMGCLPIKGRTVSGYACKSLETVMHGSTKVPAFFILVKNVLDSPATLHISAGGGLPAVLSVYPLTGTDDKAEFLELTSQNGATVYLNRREHSAKLSLSPELYSGLTHDSPSTGFHEIFDSNSPTAVLVCKTPITY